MAILGIFHRHFTLEHNIIYRKSPSGWLQDKKTKYLCLRNLMRISWTLEVVSLAQVSSSPGIVTVPRIQPVASQ